MTVPPAASEWLLVFLRRPEPGRVKTRLAATVGPETACSLYARMTRQVMETVAAWERPGTRRLAFVTPAAALEETRAALPRGFEAVDQGPGDLGARLSRAFDGAFEAGASRVVAIGTDCVEVTGELLDRAFESLCGREAVIGPARDGGYWLLGLARRIPDVFERIPWGTDGVLSATMDRLRWAGVEPDRLPVLRDLDTSEDLRAIGWL